MKIGRVTLSDRASAGIYRDLSGPAIEECLLRHIPGPHEFLRVLLPDEQARISDALLTLCDIELCELVVTTGGTGPAPRDVTPEATAAVLDRELPGFGEIMRMRSYEIVPTAILSRATAGTRGRSLIINLPGNPKAVDQCLPLLVPAILECLRHLAWDSFPRA